MTVELQAEEGINAMGKYCKTPEGYEYYDGDTWIVGDENTDDCYVFDDEELATWFRFRRGVWEMSKGSQATDNGNFFLTPAERDEVLRKEPGLKKFIRHTMGSREFIQGKKRYCFWLVDASPADIKKSKILYERVKNVKEFRLQSKSKATQRSADKPHLFQGIRQPDTEYLLIPIVSSENRQYIPMGYVSPDVIVTDLAFSLPHATPYHFGILTSSTHMAWMRYVCGRLEMRYRYSNTLVYNNFVFPKSNPLQVKKIDAAGQKILDVRAKYPECTFADLYDEVSMPSDLRQAHRENDAAVIEAYGWDKDITEYDIVINLFKLNYQLTGREMPEYDGKTAGQ